MADTDTDHAEPVEEEIIRSARSNYLKLPVLEVIFERFVLSLGPMMKSQYAGATVEATLESYVYASCGTALEEMSPHGLALVAQIQPGEDDIGVVIDPKLLFATLEILLGGRGVAQPEWVPRAYSAIERRFGQRLCQTALDTLTEAFMRIWDVHFVIDRVESSPQAMVLAAPSAPCVKVNTRIEIEGRGGILTFVLPHAVFEEVLPILSSPFRGGQLGGDSSWRELINDSLRGTSVTVDAVLHEPHVLLSDVLNWKVGQTVELGISEDQDVTVACGDLKLFSAAIGRRRNGSVALRILKDFSEEEEPTDVTFD